MSIFTHYRYTPALVDFYIDIGFHLDTKVNFISQSLPFAVRLLYGIFLSGKNPQKNACIFSAWFIFPFPPRLIIWREADRPCRKLRMNFRREQ